MSDKKISDADRLARIARLFMIKNQGYDEGDDEFHAWNPDSNAVFDGRQFVRFLIAMRFKFGRVDPTATPHAAGSSPAPSSPASRGRA